ncbi:MAG: AraC family transcriptional regulator [Ruminococcaceae bacterium]|nr:AraC family transcriptional regulator [Oscillospiraceae bacterium]
MRYSAQRESIQHGTFGFPLGYYPVDRWHPRYHMMLHWHPELEIIRVRQGTLRLELDGRAITVHAGDTVVVDGGVCHTGLPAGEDCQYTCLVFDMSSFLSRNPIAARTGQPLLRPGCHIHPCMPRELNDLDGLLEGLYRAMDNRAPGYELFVQGALYQLFAIILRERLYTEEPDAVTRSAGRLVPLKNALEYMEEHYAGAISLDDLARAAGMSRKYFCTYFRSMTGKTPVDYLNDYRITLACELLLTDDRPVTAVAMDCGFNDVSYFSRRFRRTTGITPLQYRKQQA